MDERTLIEASDASYADSITLLARLQPTGEVLERPSVVLADAGAAVSFFNVAFVNGPLPDPEATLLWAVRHFESKGLPFLVRAREGAEPGIRTAARAVGLTEAAPLPAMVLDPIPDALPDTPAPL